jgi:aminoglycoside phosphotransferase (APT) family kinase protein
LADLGQNDTALAGNRTSAHRAPALRHPVFRVLQSGRVSFGWRRSAVCEHCIAAVLTTWQLERFCQRFNVAPSELEANFNGWRKHVILSKDRAFLFPRTPQFLKAFRRELTLYEAFAQVDSLPLPRLLARVKDRAISYYEFGVVTRLPGVPFAQFIETVSYGRFERLLLDLVELTSRWHSIPRNELPNALSRRSGAEAKRTTVNNWHEKALFAPTTEEAVDFIYGLAQRLARPHGLSGLLAREAETKRKWLAAITELARLPDVLVHGDVHEESFLVDPATLEITGVLDWEAARIGNPVWDFNFGEWGLGMCRWFEHFPALRRAMRQCYLEIAGISLSTVEGLHLFYTLWEMIWLVYKRRHQPSIVITGTDYQAAVRIYLDKLNGATMALA